MRNSLSKMHYVLYALLLFALSGCGTTSNTTGTTPTTVSKAPGALTAKVVLSKSAAKSVGSAAAVVKTSLMVTGADIPTAKQDFTGNTGGTIEVFPGRDLMVTVYAYDSTGALVAEGFASDQEVESGKETDVTIQLSAPVYKAENAPCLGCHANTRDTNGQNLVSNYKQTGHYFSMYSSNDSKNGGKYPGCAGCHGANHNVLDPSKTGGANGTSRCSDCHGNNDTTNINPNHDYYTGSVNPATITTGCGKCHVGHNVRGAGGCVSCHSITQKATGNVVGDNNGVRAIMPEFRKTSHHIVNANGADPTNEQCIACHMEGQVVNGEVRLDLNYHMADTKTHLRNGNTTLTGNQSAASGAQYIWDPANPNHTAMDQFCMSCHNAAGAPAVAALGLPGQTATNPFGDTISNGVDQVARPAVVGVFEQLDPSNSSHHAVRGKKYSGRTRATTTAPAVFTQYSGAAVSPIWNSNVNFKIGATASSNALAASLNTNSNAGIGLTSPGTRKTIFEAGFFVSTYTPLGDTRSVADDSIIHCGDCHTVGQFKPGSTTNADGVPTEAVIGAHGSNNEYLLRTSTGVDEIHVNAEFASETQTTVFDTSTNSFKVLPIGTKLTATQAYVTSIPPTGTPNPGQPQPSGGMSSYRPTGGSVANTNPTENFYVCFLCHKASVYGATEAVPFAANPTITYGETRMGGHGGLHPCNDPADAESTGKTGSARVNFYSGGELGGGNIFGYTCAHCHNAGSQKLPFGGIHGNNATYGNYSSDGTWAASGNTDANIKRVNRKSYRFMGGVSLKYNGGASASKWESQVLQKSNREGCYNFTVNGDARSSTGSSTGGGVALTPGTANAIHGVDSTGAATSSSVPGVTATQWRTDAASSAAEFTDGTGGAAIFGTWGACGHHNGSTTSGANATSLRKVQRPLNY